VNTVGSALPLLYDETPLQEDIKFKLISDLELKFGLHYVI